MQYFNKPFYVIVLFAVGFYIINEISTYYVGLNNAKEINYTKDKIFYDNLITNQSTNLKTFAQLLTLDSEVLRGYKEDNASIIINHLTPLWKSVQNEKIIYEIHFFKPPAISFVNFSNFKSIGKDVSDVRTDIQWITSSFTPSTHNLMCKTFAGYRATYPILDENNKMLGGVSLGRKIDWIPQSILEYTHHHSFLIYNKKAANSLMKKYYDEFLLGKEITGEYILAERTLPITPQEALEFDYHKPIQRVSIGGKTYYANTFPIIDFNNNEMGYICTLSELSEFHHSFYMQSIKNFLLIFMTAFIIFILTRKDLRRLVGQINRIKNLTDIIKNRDFKALKSASQNTLSQQHNVTQPMLFLEENIIKMGFELEKRYIFLESENKEMSNQILEQFFKDELTGLYNRNALFRDLELESYAFVAIINIKSFKTINDVFGFDVGNYILIELAHLILDDTQKYAFNAYRIGSDEFAIVNTKRISQEDFELYIMQLNKRIEQKEFYLPNIEDTNITISVSIGICYDGTQRVVKADMALTQAKMMHKDYVVYSQTKDTQNEQKENLKIINMIKKAVENNAIAVFFQPIVNKNQQIVKYESLVRIIHNDEVISPFYFLELSKKTKYYAQITRQVISKSFQTFKTHNNCFTINLAADDILNSDTLAFIYLQLEAFEDKRRVIFEIVESEDIYNIKEIEEFIKRVKSMGVRIAIDDFGTGYSNFSYMSKIAPDIIKIDGSLVKNIDKDITAQKIVKTIVLFAHELNIRVVAEFIHSKEVFAVCEALGVDEFQGYYFSEPKPNL